MMTDQIAERQGLHDESLERYDAEIKRLEAEFSTAAGPHQGKIAKCLVRLIHERAVWRAQLEQISESPTQMMSRYAMKEGEKRGEKRINER